jgi:hypothetical protein
VRCVLYHLPGVAMPSDLLNSLARRIGRLVSCTDSYMAMAEVCAAVKECREQGAAAAGSAGVRGDGGQAGGCSC